MQTTLLQYQVLIKREGKTYISYVPTLGISDFGKTIEETQKNTENAIICHIEGLIKTNTDVPAPDGGDVYLSQTNITLPYPVHFAI